MNKMEGKYLFCQDCNAPCSRDFRKVADLRNSGLVIYVHKRKDSLQWSTKRSSDTDETYILHNTSGNELQRIDYIGELRQYQAKCFQCKRVVQKVRSLLDELTEIRENQILGVCDHCNRSKSTKKCPRCDYILKKFMSDKVRQCEERQRRFKVWLCRVKHLLQAISEAGNVCHHKMDQDPISNLELRNLLRQLRTPLAVHEPLSEFFPVEKDLASLQNLTQSKEIIDQLIMKLAQPDSDDNLDPSPSKRCICKYFMDKEFTGTLPELDFGYKADKSVGKDTGHGLKGKTRVDDKLTDRESGKTGSSGHKLSEKTSAFEKFKDGDRTKTGSVGHKLSGKTSTYEKQIDGDISKLGSASRRLKEKMSARDKQKDGTRSKILSASHKSKGQISAADKKQKDKETISQQAKSKSGQKEKTGSPGDKSLKKSPEKSSRKSPEKPPGKSPEKRDSIAEKPEELTIVKSLKERRLSRNSGKRNQTTEMTEEEKIFFRLLQELKMQKHDKQVGTPRKPEKERQTTRIASLPVIKRIDLKGLRFAFSECESFMQCDRVEEPPEMIRDTKIVPYDPHYKDEKEGSRVPLLFDMYSPDYACPDPEPPSPTFDSDMNAVKRTKSSRVFKSKGAFSYALSDRYFIETGMTKLPTEKIMRKMNIYKMEPTFPNWFDRNKSLTKFYNTGEILAEVNEDGSGKWYYKNGAIALDYHRNEDSSAGQRYVIYSTGMDGRHKSQTVLASFDFLGNGVVYDHDGNIRIKYNQSEGLIVDEKIAPPGKWKWHTLNDPPVLQRLFINTNLKNRDPVLETFHEMQQEETKIETPAKQEQDAIMLTIELDNYVKEKANKLLQEFKPFQIRMKAVKLNNNYSLKILDQANIRVFFRDAAMSLKLNIGMALISNEIIDTDTAEMSEVATPYEKRPPKTKSVANIQKMIDRSRREAKQLH